MIRLTVPGALPSIRISRGCTTTASAIAGFVTAMRVMSKSVAQHRRSAGRQHHALEDRLGGRRTGGDRCWRRRLGRGCCGAGGGAGAGCCARIGCRRRQGRTREPPDRSGLTARRTVFNELSPQRAWRPELSRPCRCATRAPSTGGAGLGARRAIGVPTGLSVRGGATPGNSEPRRRPCVMRRLLVQRIAERQHDLAFVGGQRQIARRPRA